MQRGICLVILVHEDIGLFAPDHPHAGRAWGDTPNLPTKIARLKVSG